MAKSRITPFSQIIEFWETCSPTEFVNMLNHGRQVAIRRGIDLRQRKAATVKRATKTAKPNGVGLTANITTVPAPPNEVYVAANAAHHNA